MVGVKIATQRHRAKDMIKTTRIKSQKQKKKKNFYHLEKDVAQCVELYLTYQKRSATFTLVIVTNVTKKPWRETASAGKKYWHEHKERQLENGRKYRENNLEHCREVARKRVREKRNTDVVFRLKHNVRSSIRWAFVGMGKRKNRHTEDIIGINLDDFVKYLLKTFSDRYGREWDGVEKVHIDHIIPLATAKTEEDVLKLCDYRNLQLITASDNQRKHDKIGWDDYEINKQV